MTHKLSTSDSDTSASANASPVEHKHEHPPTPTIEQTLDNWLVHDEGCQTNVTGDYSDCTCITKDVRQNLSRNLNREVALLITKARIDELEHAETLGDPILQEQYFDSRIAALKATTKEDNHE